MRRVLRENGLGLFFGGIFLLTLIGQALVGHADFNHQQLSHQDDPISLGRYVFSSSFGSDVMENWQSEFLQFTLYILATVWLLQRGSPESKELDKAGAESDKEQKVGEHADANSPALGAGRRLAHPHLLQLAGDRDDRDLARLVGRAVAHRPRRLQRRSVRPPTGATYADRVSASRDGGASSRRLRRRPCCTSDANGSRSSAGIVKRASRRVHRRAVSEVEQRARDPGFGTGAPWSPPCDAKWPAVPGS